MRLFALSIASLLAPGASAQDKKPVSEEVVIEGRLESTVTEVLPRVSGRISAVHVREGDEVKKGTVLAELESRVFTIEAERAKAMVTRAEAQAKVADARFDRVKAALEKGIVPKEEVEQAAAEREVNRAELMVAKADLELAELRLSWTKITAPADGRLNQLRLTVGNFVRADTELVATVVNAAPLFVTFDIDEKTALRLRDLPKDTKLTAAVGLATDEGFPHPVVVESVAPAVDPDKGTLRVRARMPNPDGRHLPGLSARVRLNLPK